MHFPLLHYAQQLKIKASGDGRSVWCPVRKKWLVVQPEELVRQALILALEERGYPIALMQVEKRVPGTKDRLDLMIINRDGTPFLLIEIKAPGYDLQPAIHQLARYNRPLKAPYVLALNGEDAICCFLNFEANQYATLDSFPDYPVVDKTP